MVFGQGRPVVITARSTPGGARITVHDDGIGIAREDQERIFERFERAVPSRHYGGFGLGLWIVRRVVEALDGTITVESEPGHGATFTVVLTRSSVRVEAERHLERADPRPPAMT